MTENRGSFTCKGSCIFASRVAGLGSGGCPLASTKKANQKSSASTHYVTYRGSACFPMLLEVLFMHNSFSLCAGYPFSAQCATEDCIRVSYLLANLRQWFPRYTCSPEQGSRSPRYNLGIPRLQTDSIRSRAMIGSGLMARDSLPLFRN